jgi:hypothetical protein
VLEARTERSRKQIKSDTFSFMYGNTGLPDYIVEAIKRKT